jgi:hypothetical protein
MNPYQICNRKTIGSYPYYEIFEIDSEEIRFSDIKNFDDFYEIELEKDCVKCVSSTLDFQYYYDKQIILYEENMYIHDRFLEKIYEKYDDLKNLFDAGYLIYLYKNTLYVCCRKQYTDYTKIALFKNIILNNKINDMLEKMYPIVDNFRKILEFNKEENNKINKDESDTKN